MLITTATTCGPCPIQYSAIRSSTAMSAWEGKEIRKNRDIMQVISRNSIRHRNNANKETRKINQIQSEKKKFSPPYAVKVIFIYANPESPSYETQIISRDIHHLSLPNFIWRSLRAKGYP